jgi:hypothetical protein
MTMTMIDIKIMYDCDISRDQCLETIETVIRDLAPRWSGSIRIWRSNHDQPRVQVGELKSAVIDDVTDDPAYISRVESDDPGSCRRTGKSEIRGSSADLTVVLSLDEAPFVAVAESLAMSNGLAVQVRRPTVERVPAAVWARDFFNRACTDTGPAWATVRASAEYQHKNRADGPGIRYIGLDVSECLPGLYASNFYGPAYVDLIGRDTLLTAPALDSRPAGDGVLLVVAEDPEEWDTPEAVARNEAVLDHLGREYFFAKTDPPDRYRAPTWPDRRAKPATPQVEPALPETGSHPPGPRKSGTTKIYMKMAMSGLDELGDAEFQQRVWVDGDPNVVSSFVECICTIFDDSGLGHALDRKKSVLDPAIDSYLLQLSSTVSRFDDDRWPAEVAADPAMEEIRAMARKISRMIKEKFPDETDTPWST